MIFSGRGGLLMRKMNIGLLVDNLDTDLTFQIIKGAKLGVKSLDANLYLLPGRFIKPNLDDSRMKAYNYQFNTLFDLAAKVNFDVILILLGSIASTLNDTEKREMLKAYGNVPVVTMCCDLEGYCSVMPGNKHGLTKAIEHLIDEHGAKRLGMVAGPATNQDSIEREQAFRDVLAKRGLEVSDEQIVHGNFSNHCGSVIEDLMDRNPDLDAVVFGNDQMALAGYKVFAKKGLEVGRDILVTGFDDDIFAGGMEPALTTVSANGAEIGYNAIVSGLNYLNTGKETHISSDNSVIIRKSCGCLYTTGEKLLAECSSQGFSTGDDGLGMYGNYIFGESKVDKIDDDNQRFKKAFNDCVKLIYSIGGKFFETNTISDDDIKNIQLCVAKIFSIGDIQPNAADRMMNVFRMLHCYFEMEMPSTANATLISDVFFNVYKLVSDKNIQKISQNKREMDAYTKNVNSFSENSIKTSGAYEERYRVLFDYLRSIEVKNGAIYLYNKPVEHSEKDVWVVPEDMYLVAYDDDGDMVCYPEGIKCIKTKELFNNPYYSFDNRQTRLFFPIFIGEMQYGMMICEMDAKYFEFYMKISGTLNDAMELIIDLERKETMALEDIILNGIETEIEDEFEPVVYDKDEFRQQIYKLFNKKNLQGQSAVLVFLDIDSIDDIVDQFGVEEKILINNITSDVLCDIFSTEGIVSFYGDSQFVVVLPIDMGRFERNYLQDFNEVKHRINDVIDKSYVIDINIGYLQLVMERDADISDYLEQGEAILYMQKKAKSLGK